VRREGARFIFEQDLYRRSDLKLCLQATVTAVSLVKKRLSKGDEVAYLLGLE
jgi:acyl-CoA thioester hydrolase